MATFVPTTPNIMNFLLAAATTLEISPFLDHYRQSARQPDIDILITGIGLPPLLIPFPDRSASKDRTLSSRLALQAALTKHFTGISCCGKAGPYRRPGRNGEQTIKNNVRYRFNKAHQPPFSKGWLVNPHKALVQQAKLRVVKSISVNQITTSRE